MEDVAPMGSSPLQPWAPSLHYLSNASAHSGSFIHHFLTLGIWCAAELEWSSPRMKMTRSSFHVADSDRTSCLTIHITYTYIHNASIPLCVLALSNNSLVYIQKKDLHKLWNTALKVAITFNLWKFKIAVTCPILFSENGIIVLRLRLTRTKLKGTLVKQYSQISSLWLSDPEHYVSKKRKKECREKKVSITVIK